MFKILNNETPDYLREIIEPYIHDETLVRYPLRTVRLFDPPLCRTVTYFESFFPSVLNEMNRLAPEISNIHSTYQLKKLLNNNHHIISTTTDVFKYSSRRDINIILCQLRNNVSNLNYDRFNDHLMESPMCQCNQSVETISHYFFECNLYQNPRLVLIQHLNHPHHNHLCTNVIVNGCTLCNNIQNFSILTHVSNFILQSKRF